MTSLLVNRLLLNFFIFFYSVNLISNVISFANENEQYYKDKIALQVIDDLHYEMDIDKDGEINSDEAEEFAQGKLKIKSKIGLSDKIKTHLTKDLLWKSWKNSKVYNWTVDDVIVWLSIDVELPEYGRLFITNSINGSMIPRLALSDMSFLIHTMGITNATHRKKIAIRAKDLILFGPSKNLRNTLIETEAYNVINNLHSQLDDDKDGGVDPSEADEFVRDELKYTADFDRVKRFNKNDNHISKEELWRNWKSSTVYNWTVEDVIDWLKMHVELSEYVEIFQNYNIDGSTIPRLASTDMAFLIKELKIKNPVHRKKLVLKATDLILFGPPKKIYSIMKDSILLTLVIITIGGCWLAYYQYRYSKRQLQHMQDKMNQLGIAEESLSKLQAKLDEAEEQNSRVNSEKQRIEEKLKYEFEKFRGEMSRDSTDDLFKYKHGDDDILNMDILLPEQLKILLQMNYEIEENFFTFKKLAAHQQMQNVKDMCEKLRKKKSSLIGSLKIAHSGNLDDMDKELQEAKIAVDEVRNDLLERSQRWDYIEKLTKFKIIPTPGLSALRSAFTATMNGGLAKQHQSLSLKYVHSDTDSLSEVESIKEFQILSLDSNEQVHHSPVKVREALPIYDTGTLRLDNNHNTDALGSPKPIFNLNEIGPYNTTRVRKPQKLLDRTGKFNSTDNLDYTPVDLRASSKSLSQGSKKSFTDPLKNAGIRKKNLSLTNFLKRKSEKQ